MRKLVTAAVLAVALTMASAAFAGKPISFENDLGPTIEFQAWGLTDLCGVDVWIRLDGKSMRGVLHTDSEDLVVREHWRMPAAQITFFSPTTGKSFSSPDNALEGMYLYPEGAYGEGAPAIVKVTGIQGRAGSLVDAGQLVWEGEVVGFDGPIPLVDADWGNPARVTGNRTEGDAWDAELCDALGGAVTP